MPVNTPLAGATPRAMGTPKVGTPFVQSKTGAPLAVVDGQVTEIVVPTDSAPHRVEKYPQRQRKQGGEIANLFKKPQEIFASAVNLGEYKAAMRPDKTLVLGFVAGAYIALAGCICIMMGGAVGGIRATDPGLAKFLWAALFPFGIILVVVCGGELVTSNFAVLPSALLARRISIFGLLRNWIFAYSGNLAGSLFVAMILRYTHLVEDHVGTAPNVTEPWLTYLQTVTVKKVKGSDWATQIVRGIGCNWLVCLGFWSALAAEDIVGKIWALYFPIAAFVTIGFEHSVMNMFLLPVGIMHGADVSVAAFIGKNLVPVTIGNIIGGLLVALPYWYVYWLPSHPIMMLGSIWGGRKSDAPAGLPSPGGDTAKGLPAEPAGKGGTPAADTPVAPVRMRMKGFPGALVSPQGVRKRSSTSPGASALGGVAASSSTVINPLATTTAVARPPEVEMTTVVIGSAGPDGSEALGSGGGRRMSLGGNGGGPGGPSLASSKGPSALSPGQLARIKEGFKSEHVA